MFAKKKKMGKNYKVKVDTMYIKAPLMPGQVNKNKDLANDFLRYCAKNPGERFWQALRNWSGQKFILVADDMNVETQELKNVKDTFYWEGKEQ